jgi:hypothetical protein
VTWPDPDAPCPEDWRFALKAANGSFRIYERHEFNPDQTPDFAVLWGRNLLGGHIRAPHARPSSERASRYDLQDCDIDHS